MRRLLLTILFSCGAAASEIAVTFDDLPAVAAPDSLARKRQITDDLLGHLTARKIPAVGLVNTGQLATAEHIRLLESWLRKGFELGNHTRSHLDLHDVGPERFETEIVEGEEPLRDLVRRHGGTLRYFRHPYLHTGRTDDVRSRVDAFLAKRGYTVAPVTIDNSEWIFARAFERADAAAKQKVTTEYVDYMVAKTAYYEAQSKKLFGREIRQILLVHANALNASAFGLLADALSQRGHRFITLDRALEDPAYQSRDGWRGAGGISWLDRWAITRGVPKGFFADEPRTPEWVQELAGIRE